MVGSEMVIGWLRDMVARGGSDLYITVDAPPLLRIHDELFPLAPKNLTTNDVRQIISDMTTHEQQADFFANREFNMSLRLEDVGRFRVNILQQRQNLALVIRAINEAIPSPEMLGLPQKLTDLVLRPRGLFLVVGATGSGKSTSLAALINTRNEKMPGHILTIEDPIEYLHPHKKSVVSQREVGVDTASFEAAMKNALRQRPDAILVGEIRSAEVMRQALNFAETGHLVLATLHANNASQALDRIVSFFAQDERRQVVLSLAYNLLAVVSQRLVRKAGGGRVAAMELLVNDDNIAKAIREWRREDIENFVENGSGECFSFDSSLASLLHDGLIEKEVALAECKKDIFSKDS